MRYASSAWKRSGRAAENGKAHSTLAREGRDASALKRACANSVDYDVTRRGVTVSSRGRCYSPAEAVGRAIRDSLDPVQAPGKVTTLSQMSPERRAEMERLYGARR